MSAMDDEDEDEGGETLARTPVRDVGYLSHVPESEEAIDEVSTAAIVKHPEAFRALVNDCGFPPRTAIRALVRHRAAVAAEWHSLGRSLRNAAIGVALLYVAVKLVRYLTGGF